VSFSLEGFQLFKGRRPRQRLPTPAVTFDVQDRRRVLRLNAPAFTALGSPRYVVVLVDRKGRRIALRAAREPGRGVYAVSSATRAVSAGALIQVFGIVAGVRAAQFSRGALVFSMDVQP